MTAGRRAPKARGKSVSARENSPARRPKAPEAEAALRSRIAALEKERDRLQDDLDRTRAMLVAAETVQAQVRDRIAWALDSLHNILDGKR